MPKVLICASTSTHIKNFHLPYLEFFKKQGFETHVAVPGNAAIEHADIVHSIPVTKAFFQSIILKRPLCCKILSVQTDMSSSHPYRPLGAVCRLGVVLAGKGEGQGYPYCARISFYRGCAF